MSYRQTTKICLFGSSTSPFSYVPRFNLVALLLIAMVMLLSPIRAFAQSLQITMSATLSPAFDPNITDYVVAAGPSTSVDVTVNAPRNTKVSIDGQPYRKLSFTTTVNNLSEGQKFTIVVTSLAGTKTYYVRRLPSSFPAWTTQRPGTPQSEYYIFAPNINLGGASGFRYAIIADTNGVPIWWYRPTKPVSPIDVKLLSNGNIGWIALGYGEEIGLDGKIKRLYNPGGQLDNHELLLLPNGNYIMIVNKPRGPVDLTAFGGHADATVTDNVIEEVTPDGTVVWSWSTMDHASLNETVSHWWAQYMTPSTADPYHMNSVELDGDGYVVSLRHFDAVIRIDKATGARVWKLGGTPRPESLSFIGDPFANFGGQHFARILPDGALTVHDNGTQQNRAPRAVRFRLDTAAGTATTIEQKTDSNAPNSACCGSATKLPGGNWVMEWGANPNITELAPDGSLVFRMNIANKNFSYRVYSVPLGTLTRTALRNGMDTMHPR